MRNEDESALNSASYKYIVIYVCRKLIEAAPLTVDPAGQRWAALRLVAQDMTPRPFRMLRLKAAEMRWRAKSRNTT